MFLTILPFNSPPTRLLVLCHSFGTFFVRVCNVDPLFFRVYRYGFISVQNMAAASIGRIIIIGAFWIFRMPPIIFDVIL